ncbi:MAG: type II toxin-antitoxin system VapC family toxin [Pseudomonadota bacterium]
MKYLLDTNVVSELRKAGQGKADGNVVNWHSDRDPADFAISVVTLMEIELGVARMERRDEAQGGLLRRWFEEQVIPQFAGTTLPITDEIARHCALLHIPDPRPERDAWIAATAQIHGLTLVTRNKSDFSGTGVEIVNPWQ